MLAIPPFGASSNIALWRANIKPPVELVVDDLALFGKKYMLDRNLNYALEESKRVWE